MSRRHVCRLVLFQLSGTWNWEGGAIDGHFYDASIAATLARVSVTGRRRRCRRRLLLFRRNNQTKAEDMQMAI